MYATQKDCLGRADRARPGDFLTRLDVASDRTNDGTRECRLAWLATDSVASRAALDATLTAKRFLDFVVRSLQKQL
jgi:hypothetical protein